MRSLSVMLVLLLVTLGGCSSPAGHAVQPSAGAQATTAPAPRLADLSLEEIEPRVSLPAPRPSTRPATRPSVEALNFYAEGFDAIQTGRRFAAIGALERALALDPDSFEANYALGRAHVIGRTHDEQSIAALERAAAIEPDNLRLQAELGRQYLARGDQAKGLNHLRLALQTTAYQADEP